MPLQNGVGMDSHLQQNGTLPSISTLPHPAEATMTHVEAINGAEKAVAIQSAERRNVGRAILKRSSSGRVIGPRTSQPAAEIPPPIENKSLEQPQDYTSNLIYPGLYAPSGFDMMSILVAVALRPNPRIAIGPIDASCALLLCDASKPDMPIVYSSEAFSRLTGYPAAEILGLNCRFLQSPDGNVQPGVPRTHVSDAAVFLLKKQLLAREEAQTSLVNYRKGGARFTNFLTTIPVQWQTAERKTYIVGFLADVSEQFWVGSVG
ncbi:blue light receptor [Xylographa soralifera]|nr:blue light receptor [Xylographa soralifera]